LIPQYALFAKAGMVNTFWPLMIPRFFGHPFYIFIMRQFFMTLPKELDEAAEIDGASLWQTMRRVILPLSKPAVATVAIFSFVNHWNDFTEPLVYLLTPENQTLALGLRWFLHNQGGEFTAMMAAATVFTAPMLVAFFFAQKQFIRGIQLTGLKEG
ncbi:MAG: carbohydrate ABC transporter permease, partial [Actinobacteria bacterium]|nr:carbohydrate ABC transporter permease [Actinomycetota bacterium]